LECEKVELEHLIKKLTEEIHKLKKKVKILELQNEELRRENAHLKNQLEKTLKTLKIVCEKYRRLKEKCKHDHNYCPHRPCEHKPHEHKPCEHKNPCKPRFPCKHIRA